MGILGLTSFMESYSDKYLEDFKLKDCRLVIDGNSIACQLYLDSSKLNKLFGGDYDRIASCFIEFIRELRRCNVSPLVIFDGGYEKHRLRTIYKRLKEKWSAAKGLTPRNNYKNHVFPYFLIDVFKDVLWELRVPFAQSLFEADVEVAAIARYLKCPVLSYDSDFFVYDVPYIPFPTLDQYPYKVKTCSNETSHYLHCRLYRVEKFLNYYKNLHKEMLPLLSIMLGNDYVSGTEFTSFVSNLEVQSCRGSNCRHRKIQGLLKWLQTETLESAKSKVLQYLARNKSHGIMEQIKNVLSMYSKESSELMSVLGFKVPLSNVEVTGKGENVVQVFYEDINVDMLVSRDVGSSSCNHDNSLLSNEYVSSGNDSDNCIDVKDFQSECTGKQMIYSSWEVRKATCLPQWFIDIYKKGDLPAMFMDMIILHDYFISPQIEDYNYPCSHTISISIIAVIYGLLVGSECPLPLKCHIRGHLSSTNCVEVSPVVECASFKFPSLHNLPKLPMSQRLLILIETASLNSQDMKQITSFPLSWQLYIVALIFWARETEQPVVNNEHIDALLLCMILFDIVEKNARNLHSSKQNKKNWFTPKNKNVRYCSNSLHMFQLFEHVKACDCDTAKKVLRPFCFMERRLKTHPNSFCITTVHSFAQFQSCLSHFIYLNALLGYPFPHCIVSQLFSGTFLYNMYDNLKQQIDVVEYISHLLSKSPSIVTLFRGLQEVVRSLIPKKQGTVHLKRKPRKKKQKKSAERVEDSVINVEAKSVDTGVFDPCNRFSALTFQ